MGIIFGTLLLVVGFLTLCGRKGVNDDICGDSTGCALSCCTFFASIFVFVVVPSFYKCTAVKSDAVVKDVSNVYVTYHKWQFVSSDAKDYNFCKPGMRVFLVDGSSVFGWHERSIEIRKP